MAEYLLGRDSSENTNGETTTIKEDLSHSDVFEIDILEDTLKHIYSKSSIKKKLAFILAIFYKYPTLIIIFSFLFGFIFFCLPLILIYLKVYQNFMDGFCIMLLITFVLSLLIFIVRVGDDSKNRINMACKWERKNLINIIGQILALILLIISGFLYKNFFGDIYKYNKDEKLKIIYEPEEVENNDNKITNINDFFLNFIINCFLLNVDEIKNEETKVTIFTSVRKIIKKLIKKLCISSIPFFIYIFNKLLQTIIIQVKYTIPKLIIFSCSFCFCSLIIVSKFLYKVKQENKVINFFEMSFITFIFNGYLALVFNSIWRIFKNPKDKNFAIDKYDLTQLILIYFFDFMNIIGTSFIFISSLISYINFTNKSETFNDLTLSLTLLKIGFLLFILSNSLYYGHTFLALIFRPIALQYAPVKLKENYIRASRNISSYIFI